MSELPPHRLPHRHRTTGYCFGCDVGYAIDESDDLEKLEREDTTDE